MERNAKGLFHSTVRSLIMAGRGQLKQRFAAFPIYKVQTYRVRGARSGAGGCFVAAYLARKFQQYRGRAGTSRLRREKAEFTGEFRASPNFPGYEYSGARLKFENFRRALDARRITINSATVPIDERIVVPHRALVNYIGHSVEFSLRRFAKRDIIECNSKLSNFRNVHRIFFFS